MADTGIIQVVKVTHEHLSQLQELWRADWLEEHPDDQAGAAAVADGITTSLVHHDSLRSDSFCLLAAQIDGKFIGYTRVIRIPKLDARLLFLFVDELFVLKSHRRRRAATAILEAVIQLGTRLGAKGVRLITRCDNEPAKHLYEQNGFKQYQRIFCERLVRP